MGIGWANYWIAYRRIYSYIFWGIISFIVVTCWKYGWGNRGDLYCVSDSEKQFLKDSIPRYKMQGKEMIFVYDWNKDDATTHCTSVFFLPGN